MLITFFILICIINLYKKKRLVSKIKNPNYSNPKKSHRVLRKRCWTIFAQMVRLLSGRPQPLHVGCKTQKTGPMWGIWTRQKSEKICQKTAHFQPTYDGNVNYRRIVCETKRRRHGSKRGNVVNLIFIRWAWCVFLLRNLYILRNNIRRNVEYQKFVFETHSLERASFQSRIF